MDAEQILKGIRDISVPMSKEQVTAAWEALRVRNRMLEAMATTQFAKGDTVEFTGRGGKTLRGVVKKINQKSVSVDVKQKRMLGNMGADYNVTWRVSPSLLKRA